MNIAVRPASLSGEREELIGLLERNLPAEQARIHFPWRHDRNPAGPGWSWVIYERRNGALRGMTTLTPRPMYLDSKPVMGGQVCEFVVDKDYRSLGPALMLQRVTFEPVDNGALNFAYDCPPHNEGMSTFLRLGMRPSCEVSRYALALGSDEVLGKKLGNGAWVKPVIAGANLLLRMRPGGHEIPQLEISTLDGKFNDEFTLLDKHVPSSGTIRASRTAELLNWRYRSLPEANFEVLVARRQGELLAFLVLMVYERNQGLRRALIADLFGFQLDKAGVALLHAAIATCRRKNVVCLEGYCSETSPLKPLFEAAGFRARERTARIVTYSGNGTSGNGMNLGVSWPVGHVEITH